MVNKDPDFPKGLPADSRLARELRATSLTDIASANSMVTNAEIVRLRTELSARDAEIATLREQLREANCRAFDAEKQMEEQAAAHRTELARAKNALNEQMEKWDNIVTRSHGVSNFDSREGLTEWWWFFATGLLDVPANLVSREG